MGGQAFNADVCNSAREGGDISPTWESILYEVDVGARYNDFDIVLGPNFAHFFQLHAPCHALCAVYSLLPMLIGS